MNYFTKTHAVITAHKKKLNPKIYIMKTLKVIFSLFALTLFLSSCTPQALDDDQNTNAVEDIQATGGENTSTNNGSKG